MLTRKLGRSGLEISALGMGCWAIGGDAWGDINDDDSIKAIHRAFDLGVNFFDTADVYGLGHSEEVVGRALGDRREQVIIATKFGNSFNPQTGERLGPNGSPAYMRQACENSLRRLNTDYIDLYQFHVNTHDPHEAEETRDALETLVTEGKIRYYGWSTDYPERAEVFAQGQHCTAIQQRLNVFDGNKETLAVCEKYNLASINRGPLAMGLLTGKFKADSVLPAQDIRGRGMAWIKYFQDGKPAPEFLEKLAAIRDILSSEGRTLTQGALAWIWAQSEQTIPIPGFKNIKQVEENVGALKFGPLTSAQVEEIETLLSHQED